MLPPEPTTAEMSDLSSFYCTRKKSANVFPPKANRLRQRINTLLPVYRGDDVPLPADALIHVWDAWITPKNIMIPLQLVHYIQLHLIVSNN